MTMEGDRSVDFESSDSVCQVIECYSKASSKAMTGQIELDCKRAELKAHYDLAKAKAHAEAQAKAAEAHRCIKESRLDAEKRLIALSERGSSVSPSRRQGSVSSSGQSSGLSAGPKSHRGGLVSVVRRHEPRVSVEAARIGFWPNDVQPSLPIEDDVYWDDKPKAAWSLRLDPKLPTDALARGCLKPSPIHREDLLLRTHLHCQSRKSLSTLLLILDTMVKT